MDKKTQNIEKIRHSLAHLTAIAVLEKFPKAKLGIGPTIENGNCKIKKARIISPLKINFYPLSQS